MTRSRTKTGMDPALEGTRSAEEAKADRWARLWSMDDSVVARRPGRLLELNECEPERRDKPLVLPVRRLVMAKRMVRRNKMLARRK